MKKTVFFDLGNVLLFFDHQKMYKQITAFCGLETAAVQKFSDPYERGTIDSWGIYHEICAVTQKQLDFHGLMQAMSDIFEPNLQMIPLIKELKKNQVPLYILSNTCEAHFDYAYTHYPLLHLFDGYVLSYEVGSRKPEKQIFEKALAVAGCGPEECFYTDDISEHVEAARQLNIDAEIYKNHQQLIEQLNARGILIQ